MYPKGHEEDLFFLKSMKWLHTHTTHTTHTTHHSDDTSWSIILRGKLLKRILFLWLTEWQQYTCINLTFSNSISYIPVQLRTYGRACLVHVQPVKQVTATQRGQDATEYTASKHLLKPPTMFSSLKTSQESAGEEHMPGDGRCTSGLNIPSVHSGRVYSHLYRPCFCLQVTCSWSQSNFANIKTLCNTLCSINRLCHTYVHISFTLLQKVQWSLYNLDVLEGSKAFWLARFRIWKHTCILDSQES